EKKAQYLYRQGNSFHFMDLENFEERVISKDNLGDKVKFFKENMEVILRGCEGRIVEVELPTFVDLKVKKASPGVKGDTVSSATKLVVLESGYSLQVPLFIKRGEIIRIDTRSGEYIGKA
ncbi:MAG: elongation factor P, partial [Candidatus Aerophobetes bacterium]|nr:elongation factor P [Candidatus Aerophobetes bacterium]